MKKTARIIALVMALVLVLAMFAGCQSKEPEDSSTPEVSSTPSASPTPSASEPEPSDTEPVDYAPGEYPYQLPILEEPTTYTVYGYDRPFLWSVIDNYDENLIQATLADITNVVLEFYWFTSTEQLQVNLASRDYYDVYWAIGSFYNGGLSRAYEDGVIIRLNDLVDEYMPNYMSWLGADDYGIKAAYDADGNMLAIYQLLNQPQMQQGTQIRGDWLDDIGMTADDIVTYDDYYNYLMAVKVELGVEVPVYMYSNGTTAMVSLGAGYGANSALNPEDTNIPWQQENGVIQYGPVQDGYLDYLTMLRQWYVDGLYTSDFTSHKDKRFLNDWDGVYEGKYAMLFRLGGDTDEPNQRGREHDPDYNLICIPDAVQNEGDILQISTYSYARIFMDFCVNISTACADPEIICKFYDFCYSNDGSLLCNYGVEGVSYEMVDGEPRFIDAFMYENPVVPADMGINMVRNAMLGTNSGYLQIVYPLDQYVTQQSIDARDTIKSNLNLGDIATTKNVFAAISVSVDVSTEYSNIMSEIQTFANEWVAGFIIGDNTADDWEWYKSTIESMNLSQAQQWMQDAYDEFMSRG